MSSVSLFVGEGLQPLADQLLTSIATESPLAKRTVVVPNPQVGQWLEQYVASQWGAVANWNVLLVDPFLASVLYANPDTYNAWSALALAGQLLVQRGESPLSVTSANARGRNLREVALWRPEDLDRYIASAEQQLEARVVAHLRESEAPSPWEALAQGVQPLRGDVVLFGVRDLQHGALLPAVVRALGAQCDVQVFLSVPALPGTAHEDSLVAAWGAPQMAHFDLWRHYLPDAVITTCHASPSLLRSALTGQSVPSASALAEVLELHGAVGPGRQVEVARDVIARLIDGEGIAPHEVRVVTTDPYQFAPLFDAEWRHNEPSRQSLQFEVADPSLARASFRLEALVRLLRTVNSHFTVNDFVALISEPACLAGLGLSAGEAERLRELAVTAMSLGLTGASRANLGVYEPDDDSGTWQRFADRGLLATVFEPTRSADADILTLGVPDDREAMAAIAELTNFLLDSRELRETHQSLTQWTSWLRDVSSRFIGFVPDVTDNGLEKVMSRFDGLVKLADPQLNYTDVVELVESVANGLGGGQTFGRGGVVVQGLDGLADAPFRVTCILGLDDDLIPSPTSPPAHLAPARVGDPSPRTRFRTNVLANVLSTSDRVILFTTDRSVRDSSAIGLSVPLAELESALRPSLGGEGFVLRRHPRHGFSVNIETANVAADIAVSEVDAFTLDGAHAAIATALASRLRTNTALEDDAPTPPSPSEPDVTIDVEELRRFVRSPQERYIAKFLSGARLAPSVDEVGRTPRRELTRHIELPALKRALVRAGLEQGPTELAAHDDDLPSLVATAFRAGVETQINREQLSHFVENHRSDLAALGGMPSTLEGPATITVQESVRPVTRASVVAFERTDEVVVVRTTTSSSAESAFLPAVLDLCIATLATSKPVRLVIVRPAETTAAPGNAWIQLTWAGADVATYAQGALWALAKIYDSQYSHPPVLVRRTTMHALAKACETTQPNLKKIVNGKNPAEMWDGGFTISTGEKDDAVNQLLLPYSYEELTTIYSKSFQRIVNVLAGIVNQLAISINAGSSSWITGVEGDNESL